jgi:hypothetical protein
MAGLDQHSRARVAFQVAHLLRFGIGPDPNLTAAWLAALDADVVRAPRR